MTSTLQEVDPADLTTVLWDYNDSTGANNSGTVKTWLGLGGVFNLSAPGVSIDTSNRLGDGAQGVTFSYDDIVQSSFRMRAQATSYDNLRQGIGVLQRLLGADGVMKWTPHGSSNTFYIYRKPSNIPALFAGDDLELYQRLLLFDSPEGVLITINRERLLRGPMLLSTVNQLQNTTLLIAGSATSTGMANWDWDSTSNITTAGYGANVNWANQSYRFTIATGAVRSFRQATGPASAAPGDVWTLSFYAKATGGAGCKAQAVLEFIDTGTTVLATATGTLTALSAGADFVRLSVTSSAAPASTDHMRINLRMDNDDATAYTVDFRRVQLEKAASASQYRVGSLELVANNIATHPGKTMLVYNPGDANALVRLSLKPSSSADAVAYLLARRSEGLDANLAEGINYMTTGGNPWRTKAWLYQQTLYTDSSSQPDSDASDGNAIRTTFGSVASLVRRWRWKSTPTDTEALNGTWDVYAAVRGVAGKSFRICMHWQAADRDPVSNTEDEIIYDCTDTASSVYTPLLLGQVTFDAGAGDTALVIEGWAACDTGSVGNLWWDVLYLVPADEQQTLVQVPGFRTGQQSRETWLGSELTTRVAGAAAGPTVAGGATKVVMDTQYQGVGTPPSSFTTGGLVWAAGRHRITAAVTLQEPAPAAAVTLGAVRIRKAPGVGGTVQTWTNGVTSLGGNPIAVGMFVKPTAGNLNGRTFVCTSVAGTHTTGGSEPTWPTTNGGTVTDNPGANQIVWTETTVASVTLKTKDTFTSTRYSKTVAADADGSTAYEGVVIMTAATVAGRKIHVLTLKHTTLRVVDNTYSAQMLGDLELVQTANGSVAIDELVKEGPYITLGPGLNILWVDLWSLAPAGYEDIDPRDPLAKHDPTRTTTVAVDIIPRYWG